MKKQINKKQIENKDEKKNESPLYAMWGALMGIFSFIGSTASGFLGGLWSFLCSFFWGFIWPLVIFLLLLLISLFWKGLKKGLQKIFKKQHANNELVRVYEPVANEVKLENKVKTDNYITLEAMAEALEKEKANNANLLLIIGQLKEKCKTNEGGCQAAKANLMANIMSLQNQINIINNEKDKLKKQLEGKEYEKANLMASFNNEKENGRALLDEGVEIYKEKTKLEEQLNNYKKLSNIEKSKYEKEKIDLVLIISELKSKIKDLENKMEHNQYLVDKYKYRFNNEDNDNHNAYNNNYDMVGLGSSHLMI